MIKTRYNAIISVNDGNMPWTKAPYIQSAGSVAIAVHTTLDVKLISL